jgi:hypothetical protein
MVLFGGAVPQKRTVSILNERQFGPGPYRLGIRPKRTIQIGPEILDGLDPHTQAQQRWRQVLPPGSAGSPLHGGLD